MTDYISREAANNALRECVRAYPNSFYNGIEVARTVIHKLPAADVRPVARGKWQFHMFTANSWGYECRVCHTTWDSPTNFCPNCGADMREPPKEES